MFNIHQYNLNDLLKKVMEYIYDVYKKEKKTIIPKDVKALLYRSWGYT
jgi:hypothetical protein